MLPILCALLLYKRSVVEHFALLHRHLPGHSFRQNPTIALHDVDDLVQLLVLRFAVLVVAVDLDLVLEEAVVVLPVDLWAGVAMWVEPEAEVAMPDQHRQQNLDKDRVALEA